MSNAQSPAKASEPINISPSQRAAVVIAMLGETAAKPIVEMLDDGAIINIAEALESINYLAREQLIEIVIDFLQQLRRSSGSMRGSPETAREFLSSVLDEPRLNVIYGGGEVVIEEEVPEPENKEDYSRLWATFSKREPAHIVKYLSGLTPNIIGLILRNLDPTLCSELICMLDEDLQTKILGELVDPPPPSYEIDSVVARMVRMEFLLVPEEEDDDGDTQLQSLGEMLSLMPNERRTSLIDYVAESHANKLEEIQKGLFQIADIPKQMSRNQVPILFKSIDPPVMLDVLSCLQSEFSEVAEYFLSNISNRMADQLRTDLEMKRPPNYEASQQIQKDFLMALMGLKRDGIITIERPEEDEEEEA